MGQMLTALHWKECIRAKSVRDRQTNAFCWTYCSGQVPIEVVTFFVFYRDVITRKRFPPPGVGLAWKHISYLFVG